MKALALSLILALPMPGSAASQTPGQAVGALWRALSHEAGQAADAAALRQLFHPDAMVYGARYRNGAASLSATRGAEFAAGLEQVQARGFFECEVARTVQEYDRFAAVYSVVESRTERAAAKAGFTGVNSIQLYRGEQGWQIVALYYHVEKPGLPVPLDGGKPGACLEGA